MIFKKKIPSLLTIVIAVFFSLYLILPNYFAFEFSENFPLLTASRILILFLAVIVFVKKRGKVVFIIQDNGYITFILILLFVNVVNISSSYISSIKTVFLYTFEYLLLSYLIVSLVNDEKKINVAISAMVYASIIVGILGAIETIFGVNFFYYLTTTEREMLQSQYMRYGVLRASGPFGHAVYFGNYALCILPFCLYLYDMHKKIIFFFAFLLNIVSIFLSGSRASVVFLIFLLLYILTIKSRVDIKKYTRILFQLFPLVVVVVILIPNFMDMLFTVLESSLDSLVNSSTERFDVTVGNANALQSRLEQWSGILWTIINEKTLFGFGNNAHMDGLISYLVDGKWARRVTFDVGFVAVFCQYGLIGTVGYFILYFTRFINIYEQKKIMNSMLKKDNCSSLVFRLLDLQTTFQIFFVGYLIHLFSSSGVDKLLVIVISLQISANCIFKKSVSNMNTNVI